MPICHRCSVLRIAIFLLLFYYFFITFLLLCDYVTFYLMTFILLLLLSLRKRRNPLPYSKKLKTESKIFILCCLNRWQLKKKCFVSSDAQWQSHKSFGVSTKLCLFLSNFKRLRPKRNWNKCFKPVGSWMPKIDFGIGRMRVVICFLKA